MSDGVVVTLAEIVADIFIGVGELAVGAARGLARAYRISKEAIEAEIERQKKQRYEKWKREEPGWIASTKRSLEEEYNLEIARLHKAEDEYQRIIQEASKEYSVLGHTYSLTEQKKQAQKALEQVRAEIKELEEKRMDMRERFDQYAIQVNRAKSFDDIVSRPHQGHPHASISEKAIKSLKGRVEELNKRIQEFIGVVDAFTSKLSQEKDKVFVDRISSKLDKIDPTKEGSMEAIKDFIEMIKMEIRNLEEKTKEASASKEAVDEAKARIAMLNDLLKKLAPTEELIEKYQTIDAKAAEKAAELYDECLESLKEFDELTYVPERLKEELSSTKRKLAAARDRLEGDNAVEVLSMLKNEIEKIKEHAKASAARRARYDEALQKYRQIHDKYPKKALINALGDKYAHPEAFRYEDSEKDEVTITRLEQLTELLTKTYQEALSREVVNYFVERIGSNLISKKKTADGGYEITYTNKEERNVIYVVNVGPDGSVKIGPRGVKAHDGRTLTSKEQLEKPIKGCAWSKRVKEDFKNLELDEVQIAEDTEAEGDDLYLDDHFYQLDNLEETLRFLRKNGWSEKEIKEFLGESVSEAVEEDTEVQDAVSESISIDPNK